MSGIINIFKFSKVEDLSQSLNIPCVIEDIMNEEYIPMFPRPDPSKAKKSKNLVFKNIEAFEAALDEVFSENREGFILLGRS